CWKFSCSGTFPWKTTHAWKNLFGSVDHEQLQQDFQHILYNSVEGAQHKWNFDFLRDMLVEGVLQWEELRSHRVPAFYHSSPQEEDQKPEKAARSPANFSLDIILSEGIQEF
uniref:Cyclin-dependent kinase inhibitor domain-containing protein n=1 Tax=Otus sunia TaxID=257818 RepID=A0A8C8BGL4_9STRI